VPSCIGYSSSLCRVCTLVQSDTLQYKHKTNNNDNRDINISHTHKTWASTLILHNRYSNFTHEQAPSDTRVEAVWILTALCQLLCSSACIMSVQLQSVSSAVFSQLSCNLSALAYSVMQFICCDRPDLPKNHLSFEVRGSFAVRHLSYNLPTQSWSVSLAAVCQRSLSAQLQYGNSAAMCQLSCTLLAQIKLVSSAARSAATFWLSCNLSSFGLCPLVAMNTDICKRQSDEACNNHVAHCYADALLQILAILAKQICKWALSRMARIISESHLEQWLLCEDLEA